MVPCLLSIAIKWIKAENGYWALNCDFEANYLERVSSEADECFEKCLENEGKFFSIVKGYVKVVFLFIIIKMFIWSLHDYVK